MAALEREIATYNAKLPELLGSAGKFVLIKGDDVLGIFEAYADALQAGYGRHAEGGFLVKRITPDETVASFTRDLSLVCRA